MFSEQGKLKSCKIIWDKADRSTGEAIVEFENPKQATEAVKTLNDKIIQG